MKKSLLALLALVASSLAFAGPTLTTAPYDVATTSLTSAYALVNGSARVECTLVPAQQGTQVVPTCDLSTLAKPGSYSIVVTVVSDAQICTPDASTPANWTCTSGGTASTDPFTLTLRGGSVSRPVVRLVP